MAKDISGHGNHLPLVRPPRRHDLTVDKVTQLPLPALNSCLTGVLNIMQAHVRQNRTVMSTPQMWE